MIIKICGIRTKDIAESTSLLQPDLLGFMFAESKRRVTPQQAGEMIAAFKRTGSTALAAGVFVNPSLDELQQTLDDAPLDLIQLHGLESADMCRAIKARFPGILLYKVFAVSSEDLPALSRLEPYRGVVDGIMLDTVGGGTGSVFAWEVIPDYSVWAKEAGIPLLVAGGLDPDNVAELVTRFEPDGVDVSSGVETNGSKDINKIKAFIERVKTVDRQRT